MEKETVQIRTEFIKLQDLLKIEVTGETCTMRGKKMRPGDVACIDDQLELTVQ